MRRLKYGFYPIDMVEKWFVYTKCNSAYFHHSWTGFCIFVIRFEHIGLGYRAEEILVNREREQVNIEKLSDAIPELQQAFLGLFQIYI